MLIYQRVYGTSISKDPGDLPVMAFDQLNFMVGWPGPGEVISPCGGEQKKSDFSMSMAVAIPEIYG